MKSSPNAKRIACLWFPDWPLQRLLQAKPELARTVLLLTEQTSHGEFVVSCNRWASRRGISAGMPLVEARSLVYGRDALSVEPMRPEADRAALEEVALRCESYSPSVGLEEADSPQSVLLDVTGIAHLFGGEWIWVCGLRKQLAAERFNVRIALGDSVGAAWAAAHYLACSEKPLILPAGQCDILWDVPVEGLRLDASVLGKLSRLGIRTTGQVFRLGRSSLPARFGNELNLRIDQLLGKKPEPIVPCRPQPKFQVEHIFDESTAHAEILECWLARLTEQLAGLLQERQLGTRHLQCTLVTEQHIEHKLTVRLCEATADARQLGELLRLHMERLRMDTPVVRIRMEAFDPSDLEPPQTEFLDGPTRHGACQLLALLNRLSSRLGYQAVVRPSLLSEAIPERACQYVPVVEGDSVARPSWPCNFTDWKPVPQNPVQPDMFLPLDRPTCLLPQPRRVDVITVMPDGPPSVFFLQNTRFDIVQSWGAERIQSGWWHGESIQRDYYQVQTADGRRFWLFRRLTDRRWFLHGGIL